VVFFLLSFPNLIVIFGDCVDVFDGATIVLAMYTLNLFHPGIYLRGEDYPAETSSEGTSSESSVMEDHLKPTYSWGKAVNFFYPVSSVP
jgi:hypothetical protein